MNLNEIRSLLETSQESDYVIVIISLIFCILASFLLMYVYKYKSNSLSSKIQIAPIIPLLSTITFLVILIVKSSLALSLGLVGALSVIRFRTPVKEPEDLAFLFLSIGIGIGYGATQIYLTTIVFLTITIIIWFFFLSKTKILKMILILSLRVNHKIKIKFLLKLKKMLKEFSVQATFVKLEQDNDKFVLYFRVSFQNVRNINIMTQELNKKLNDVQFSIYENRVID